MFFKLACLYLAVTCVFAAPSTDVVPLEKQQPTVIPIVSQSEELEANGTFKYSYATGNGIKREETSYDKVLPKAKSGPSSSEGGEENDESNEIHVQQGSYSYTAPDGTVITVRYIADENGFRPIGDHLPKPPSVALVGLGRQIKTISADNRPAKLVLAEASKVPKVPKASEGPQVPEAAKTPGTPETPQSPAVELRIAESSAEQASTSEASSEPTTSATEADVSTTEVTLSTTEQDKVASTETASTPEASSEQPTTSEAASTPETSSEQPATTEAASTPEATSELSTSEATSEITSKSSTSQEPASTPAEEPSTPIASTAASSEVTTEIASTPSA